MLLLRNSSGWGLATGPPSGYRVPRIGDATVVPARIGDRRAMAANVDFSYTYGYRYTVSAPSGGDVSITSGPVAATYTLTGSAPEGSADVGTSMLLNGSVIREYLGYLGTEGVLASGFDGESTNYYIYSNDNSYTGTVSYTAAANPYCLLAGTLVLTPSGERRVEDIRIGDEVVTHDGDAVRVCWVGRQSLISLFAPHATPVTIHAGALGDDIPSRDLHVSPDHALLVDGYLVVAQALVNGSTVTVMADPPQQLDYYHLELDRHRVIVANGAPVESFVDDVSRAGFDNYDEWVGLGLEPQLAEQVLYVKVKSQRQLPASIATQLARRTLAGAST